MDKETAFGIANKYVKFLKDNKFVVVRALLFGSYAKGNFKSDSDIDIALVFDRLDDRLSTQVKLLMLTPKIDTRIEPHPFEESDLNINNPFACEILKYGIELI